MMMPSPTDRPLRMAHLTTVDMSLVLLLGTELSEDLAAGHTVFGISAPGRYVERVAARGVVHVPIPSLTRSWGLREDGRAFVDLVRTLRGLDLDVLHTHNPKTGVMGRIAGRLAGIPIVVNTCHGLWAKPEDPIAKRAFVYGLEGFAARFSDYELFQNADDERTMARFLKSGRHQVVGNGIDLQHFTPDVEGRRRLRAQWGVPDDAVLVGAVGRRVAEKGLREFAAAATALGDRATFVWIGPDDDEPLDEATTAAVTFIPEQSDMPAVYSALDIFVLPSHREGFSRASMEAAACALPMVLSDIRGCREIGDDGVHLLLSPAQDAPALIANVRRLLDSPGLRADLGAKARARALDNFDQRRIAQLSLATYDDVASHKGIRVPATDRIRVLHVLPDDRNRGAQVYAGRLRDSLRDDPTQEHLLVTLFNGPAGASCPDIELGQPSGALRRAGIDPLAVRALRRAIKRSGVDVVVAHGGEPLKYAVAAGTAARVIYYKIGLATAELRQPGRVALYRRLARATTAAVAVSHTVKDQLCTTLGMPPARVSVIPNGRDPDVYRPAEARGGEEPPLVLWIGQLEPGKRPGLFVDVVERLRGHDHPFRAAIVGDGHLRSSIASRAADLGVDLLGTRSDVPDLLRSASLVVMTSAPDTEGMPGVLVEAGLSGIPVVSTAAAGVRDVVEDGVTGYVIDNDDPGEIAQRAVDLLQDPALRADLGAAGRRRCEERFSLDTISTAWHDLVERVAR